MHRYGTVLLGGLLALAASLHGDDLPKTASYAEVAVFPLPDRPPNTIEGLIAVVRETVTTGSRFEVTQRVLWLQQLPAKDLAALRGSFPSPWAMNSIPGYRDIDPFRLKEHVEMALVTHSDNSTLEDASLTAPLRAFLAAQRDWDAALELQPPEGHSHTRPRYEDGLKHAIQCADSLPEAIAMHKAMYGANHNLLHSSLLNAWPIDEASAYLETIPVDTRSGWLPHLESRGAWFFSDYEGLRGFSRRLTRYRGMVTPRVGETMAPVMAARSPERFFGWLSAQSEHHQHWHATATKKYFVRTGGIHLEELYLRFPDLRDKPKKALPWFDPSTMDLHEHAAALIRQDDPKAVQFGAVALGKRWGKADGPAAFEWTMKNVPKEHRAYWLRMVLNGWAHKDPEAAKKAFDSLDPKILNEAHDGGTLKNRDHQYTDRTPAAFRMPADLKGPAFPVKNDAEIGRQRMTDLVKLLASGVIPPIGKIGHGFPSPVLNSATMARILALKTSTAKILVGHFEHFPPKTAREMEVQRLVLERWALDDPRAASQWLVYAAPGSFRSVLQLSLGRLALEDPEAALALCRRIPEEHLAQFSLNAIARSIAFSQGFPQAIALCGDEAGQTLSNTWLRHDKEAAEAWRETHWIFD